MSDSRASGEDHRRDEQHDQRGGGEIGFEENQRGDGHQHDHEGNKAPPEVPERVAFLGREHRGPGDDGELGKLGGLEPHARNYDPAARPVYLRCDRMRKRKQQDDQEKRGQADERPREGLPRPVVDPRRDEQNDDANQSAHKLLHRERTPGIAIPHRDNARCAVDRGHPEDHQRHGDQTQEPGFPQLHRLGTSAHMASTSSRNFSPRRS